MQLKLGATVSQLFSLVRIKFFLTSVKDFCIKYWKALIAFCLVVFGIFIGRRTKSDEEVKLKIEKLDAESKKNNIEEKSKKILEINKNHMENVESAIVEKQKKIDDIEKQKLKNIDEMSNNSENLDRILKEKYNLKKGE